MSSSSNEGDEPLKVSLDEWQVEAVSIDQWVAEGELDSQIVGRGVDDDVTVLEDHTLFRNDNEPKTIIDDQRVELISLEDWCVLEVERPPVLHENIVQQPLEAPLTSDPITESQQSSLESSTVDIESSQGTGEAAPYDDDQEDDAKTVAFLAEDDDIESLNGLGVGQINADQGFGDEDLSLVETEFGSASDSVWEEEAPTEFDASSVIEKEMLDDRGLDELSRMSGAGDLGLDDLDRDLMLDEAEPRSLERSESFHEEVADDRHEMVGDDGSAWETVQTMRPVVLQHSDLAENYRSLQGRPEQSLVFLKEEDFAVHHRPVVELDDGFFLSHGINRDVKGLIFLKESDLVEQTRHLKPGKAWSKKDFSSSPTTGKGSHRAQRLATYCLIAIPLLLLAILIRFHFKYSWVTISEQQYESHRSRLSGSEWWTDKCFRVRTEGSAMRWFGRQQLCSSSYDRVQKQEPLFWVFYTNSGSEDVGDVIKIE